MIHLKLPKSYHFSNSVEFEQIKNPVDTGRKLNVHRTYRRRSVNRHCFQVVVILSARSLEKVTKSLSWKIYKDLIKIFICLVALNF